MLPKQIIYLIPLLLVLLVLTGCETQCPQIELECPECTCPPNEVGSDKVHVYFINVGQGDAQLIKYGTTEMLIDCGKNSMGPLVIDFLKAHNVVRLEYLMITHPDSDHLGGCDDILNAQVGIPTQTIITNGESADTASYTEVINEIDSEQLIEARVSDNWVIGPANIEILQTNNRFNDTNENSLVARLSYNNISVLFTGDCDNKCEDFLLEKDIQADILKVAHHGSKYATEIDFLEKVDPSVAVISVGENLYGHPAEETLDRLSQEGVQVYRTDLNGNIEIEISESEYEVK